MSVPSFSLKGKIALLTGASRGIGESIATSLAMQGAHCILTSRKIENINRAVDRITSLGYSCEGLACNAGNLADIDQMIVRIKQKFDRIDILVNNAATNPYAGPFLNATEEAWDKTFSVNVKGPFFLTQKIVPMMPYGGTIINTASVEGVQPGMDRAMYSMSKAAIISMTKAFAKELASRGIRVNAILPGLVDTQMSRSLMEKPEEYKEMMSKIPMGRHATVDEIAGAVIYLASSISSYTTGASIVIDGGMLI